MPPSAPQLSADLFQSDIPERANGERTGSIVRIAPLPENVEKRGYNIYSILLAVSFLQNQQVKLQNVTKFPIKCIEETL
jgi:hypothetical protein